jgi:hypothetical protein
MIKGAIHVVVGSALAGLLSALLVPYPVSVHFWSNVSYQAGVSLGIAGAALIVAFLFKIITKHSFVFSWWVAFVPICAFLLWSMGLSVGTAIGSKVPSAASDEELFGTVRDADLPQVVIAAAV